ncbi:MAG: transposase, partial [Actinomycetota bacterium]|nr:transposase [Actinomycetota bacterium]
MTRRPRPNVPGTHHVYARGNDRRVIFRDDRDRGLYLRLLGATVVRRRWRCLAYCLMDNHVHLLLEIAEADLAAGVQRVHGDYGRLFNERHARSGHLFQGRYGSKLVTSDEQLWWTIAYIAWNPVTAGLVRSPDDWRWSSHGAAARGRAPRWLAQDRLLHAFSGLGGDPREAYTR